MQMLHSQTQNCQGPEATGPKQIPVTGKLVCFPQETPSSECPLLLVPVCAPQKLIMQPANKGHWTSRLSPAAVGSEPCRPGYKPSAGGWITLGFGFGLVWLLPPHFDISDAGVHEHTGTVPENYIAKV